MRRVGARGVVHAPQFNGKQEGEPARGEPNLRCPRNGKQTRRPVGASRRMLRFHHAATGCLSTGPGKAMEVVLPARIPANTVVVHTVTCAPP